jgi:hypothetical protein
LANAGSNNAARMAMMAITTNNSMSVKPKVLFRGVFIGNARTLCVNAALLHEILSTFFSRVRHYVDPPAWGDSLPEPYKCLDATVVFLF